MNPKVSQLDPKLQEAYNRVMGTAINPQAAQPTQTQAPQTAAPASVNNQAFRNPVLTAQKAEGKTKRKSKLSPTLIVLVFVVFFLVYAAIWIRMFNLRVPYLNP